MIVQQPCQKQNKTPLQLVSFIIYHETGHSHQALSFSPHKFPCPTFTKQMFFLIPVIVIIIYILLA